MDKEVLKPYVDTSYRKIQCSNVKHSKSSFEDFDTASTYKFIRFGNKYFIPALSVDIDNHQNVKAIGDIIKKHRLPTPNMIVFTAKGLHVHWLLETPIKTSSEKQLLLYQKIADSIIDIFGSDKNAMPKRSGRMFRNPLLHKTIYFTNTTTSLSKFTHIVPKTNEKIKSGTKFLRYKVPDFTTIDEGSRNTTLFDYGRHIAYKYGNNDGLYEAILADLVAANSLFSKPLPYTEIEVIVTSITNFMRTKYSNKTTSKKTIEYNRKLAETKKKLKQNELLAKWVSMGFITVKSLKSMSFRAGGKLFGVSKNTFKKHLSFLLESIKLMPNIFKKFVRFVEPDNTIIVPKVVSHLYQPVTTVNCTSPPYTE